MPKVNYFELQADNPERAMAFYEQAFGWRFSKSPMGQNYWMFEAGPKDEAGSNGGMMRREFPGHGNLITIFVDSVDNTLERIRNAGGEVLHPKLAVPGIGWAAYFKDTEGNASGIFQHDPEAK
ncbi:MAG: VOC family protein [Calditrichaeota bacterium]|nr:VOC family protein [Calditrichota bacterium]